jgi:hypothetical protein
MAALPFAGSLRGLFEAEPCGRTLGVAAVSE